MVRQRLSLCSLNVQRLLGSKRKRALPLFEIALVLVRLDHVALPHRKRESRHHAVFVTLDLVDAYFGTDSALMNSGFADHSSVELWECDAKTFEFKLPSTAVNSRSSPD